MGMRSLLILSVLLALIRENKGQPKVSLPKKFPDVIVGDDVTLICDGGSSSVQWFINGALEQSHNDYLMVLPAVTSANNGEYACERDGSKSIPFNLTVLELEPHAQLSPSIGGAVMNKGGGRNLVLQVDDDLRRWQCFVSRGHRVFKLKFFVEEKMKKAAVFFAGLLEAKRATCWCTKDTQRSNSVTLKATEHMVMLEPPVVPALAGDSVALRCVVWGGKVEKAAFYKDKKLLKTITQDTYIIPGATQDHAGKYRCHATYRYSHITASAAQQEGDSDDQELNIIVGPPAATVLSESPASLRCSCGGCPAACTSYRWYHTLPGDASGRQRQPETTEVITVEKGGLYSCQRECSNGLSRLSNAYNITAPVNVMPILVAVALMFLGVLIVVLVALKHRSRGGSSVQATARDKDKTGGDYEQIQLTDQAVYHTLGESTDRDKSEGGYETLQKKQEALYNTLGAVEVQGQGAGEGQGGYEALKSVKAEVYQHLRSSESKTGEAEGGYEELPQKAGDYEVAASEENPYEELKAGQLDKKQMSKKKE